MNKQLGIGMHVKIRQAFRLLSVACGIPFVCSPHSASTAEFRVNPIDSPTVLAEAILLLLRQRDDIALQTRRLFGQFQVQVNLVQVRAHPQQNAARCGG